MAYGWIGPNWTGMTYGSRRFNFDVARRARDAAADALRDAEAAYSRARAEHDHRRSELIRYCMGAVRQFRDDIAFPQGYISSGGRVFQRGTEPEPHGRPSEEARAFFRSLPDDELADAAQALYEAGEKPFTEQHPYLRHRPEKI